MGRSISISEARARLPELAKYLSGSPHRVVLIEHRDREERLALVTEGHLRYLESIVAAAESRQAKPFKLAGSMTSELPDETIERVLSEVRAKQQALARDKVADV